MKIFVTGAAGYLGASFVFEALSKKIKVVGCDNFINSDDRFIKFFERHHKNLFSFEEADLTDAFFLSKIFKKYKFDAVIHFAGLKSVSESNTKPDKYIKNNIESTKNIISCMNKFKVEKIIFSSSAAVYGDEEKSPINENAQCSPVSVYAKTKLDSEGLIKDFTDSGKGKAVILRYFNPIGSINNGQIYEVITDTSDNVIPKLKQSIFNQEKEFQIYGNDYETLDGTPIRDYIHVSDLISGHFHALDYLLSQSNKQTYEIFNLGTGVGKSVLELVNMFSKISKNKIPISFAGRRDGDVSVCYADPSKSNKVLKWHAKKSFREMCADSLENCNYGS